MLPIADLIGKPYIDGADGPEGYDCWSLAREVFRRAGIILPDYRVAAVDASIDAQINKQRPDWVRCEGEPPVPALIVFRLEGVYANHVGVYIGGGKFIHIFEKTSACIDRIDRPLWKRKIEGFYIPGWVSYG